MSNKRTFKVYINGDWAVMRFEDIKPGDIFTHSETEKLYKATTPAVDGRIEAVEVKPCKK